MKQLTVKNPWAQLICEGIKDIENRTWKTNFRGRVLIYSSEIPAIKQSKIQSKNPLDCLSRDQLLSLGDKKYCCGDGLNQFHLYKNKAIIGSVEIVDCVVNHPSIWAEKTNEIDFQAGKPIYNWVLANPILFDKPIENVKGKLSFWEYEFSENDYECMN